MAWLIVIAPATALCLSAILLWVALELRRHAPDAHANWRVMLMTGSLVYAAGDVVSPFDLPLSVVMPLTSLQLLAAGFATVALLLSSRPVTAGALSTTERVVVALTLGLGLVASLPGVGLDWRRESYSLPHLGGQVAFVPATAVGDLDIAWLTGLIAWVAVRRFAQWRRREPLSGWHLTVTLVLFFTCINDGLVISRHFASVPLVSFGLAAQCVVTIAALLRGYLDSQHALEVMNAQLEQQVQRRSAELLETREALVRTERLAAMGRLCAGVAHEVNNPAAAIRANLDYLSGSLADAGALPADAADALTESAEAVTRIVRIVRQLLDSSRVATLATATCVPVSAAEAVARALKEAAAVLERPVQVTTSVPTGLRVTADPHLLHQVLLNLVHNAGLSIASAGVGGRVTLSGRATPQGVELLVEDDGPGISPEHQSLLFEPFFTTRGIGKGTGLGLTVSRGLMHAMGGSLELETSRPGCTRFVVRLGLAAGSAPGEPAPLVAAPEPSRPRVLLVDDDPLVLRALERGLRGTFTLVPVATVREALERLVGDGHWAAVICDVVMPDGGAAALLSSLEARRDPVVARLLFMTGGAKNGDAAAFIAAHQDRTLDKPFSPEELRRRVVALA